MAATSVGDGFGEGGGCRKDAARSSARGDLLNRSYRISVMRWRSVRDALGGASDEGPKHGVYLRRTDDARGGRGPREDFAGGFPIWEGGNVVRDGCRKDSIGHGRMIACWGAAWLAGSDGAGRAGLIDDGWENS